MLVDGVGGGSVPHSRIIECLEALWSIRECYGLFEKICDQMEGMTYIFSRHFQECKHMKRYISRGQLVTSIVYLSHFSNLTHHMS